MNLPIQDTLNTEAQEAYVDNRIPDVNKITAIPMGTTISEIYKIDVQAPR